MQVGGSSLQSDRVTLGPLHNPIRGVLHGSAALAAFTVALYLWKQAGCAPWARIALIGCALSQFALYLTSCLYHTLPWPPVAKARMQRLDHSMIYLAIAGSLTPIVVLGLDDWRREAILVAAWTIAILGVLQKALLPQVHEKVSIPFQILAASLVLPALVPFAQRFPGAPVYLVAIGASSFAVGAIFFVTERPRLWPRVFGFHELFHVCTLLGSGAHYALLVRYLSQVG